MAHTRQSLRSLTLWRSTNTACLTAYTASLVYTHKTKPKAPTSNRGGVATSSRALQELPVLKQQPKRKSADDKGGSKAASNSASQSEKETGLLHNTLHQLYTRAGETEQQAPQQAGHGQPATDSAACLAERIICSDDPLPTMLSQSSVTNKELHRLLSHLAKRRQETKALAVLEWIHAQPHLQSRRALYFSSLAAHLARTPRGAQHVLRLHESMRARGVSLDLIAYNIVISAAGKAGLWGRAQEVFHELVESGLKPDVFTYTSLMKACQSCGNRWKQALSYLDRMQSEGVQPNVTTYTTLISCCQRAGQWERAMGLFRRMEEAGISADLKAYNSVVSSCARGARWEHAWEVCGGMRRAGCAPDARTYNALISACERARQPLRALEAYRKMQRGADDQLRPTLVTLNTLISACAKGGLYDIAQRLYADMAALRIEPDVFTLSALILACQQCGRWERAIELVSEFQRRHGVKLNTVACNALITTLGRGGRWQYAQQFFEQLARGELDGAPDSWTFAALLLAFQAGGQHAAVAATYSEMRAQRLPVYRDAYFAMLEACERLGLWQQGRDVLLQMQADAAMRGRAGLDLAAWQAVFAFPPLMESVPKPLISAARAAVDTGKYARRLVSAKQRELSDSEDDM